MYRCMRGSATRKLFNWEDITYQLHQSLIHMKSRIYFQSYQLLGVLIGLADWSEPLETVAWLCLSLLVSHPLSTAMLCFRGHLQHKIQKCLHLELH